MALQTATKMVVASAGLTDWTALTRAEPTVGHSELSTAEPKETMTVQPKVGSWAWQTAQSRAAMMGVMTADSMEQPMDVQWADQMAASTVAQKEHWTVSLMAVLTVG